MGKCLEIRYFLLKFHSEGEFWHCHNPGNHLGLTNHTNKANLGSQNKKMCKVRPYTIPTVNALCPQKILTHFTNGTKFTVCKMNSKDGPRWILSWKENNTFCEILKPVYSVIPTFLILSFHWVATIYLFFKLFPCFFSLSYFSS